METGLVLLFLWLLELNNKVIIQWGWIGGLTTTVITINFPTSYTTRSTTTLIRANTNQYGNYGVVSGTISFQAVNFNNAQGLNTSWISIGY